MEPSTAKQYANMPGSRRKPQHTPDGTRSARVDNSQAPSSSEIAALAHYWPALSESNDPVLTDDYKGGVNRHWSFKMLSAKDQWKRFNMVKTIKAKLGNDPYDWVPENNRPAGLPGHPLDWSGSYVKELYRLAVAIETTDEDDALADAHAAIQAASRKIHGGKSHEPLDSDGLRMAFVQLHVLSLAAQNRALKKENLFLKIRLKARTRQCFDLQEKVAKLMEYVGKITRKNVRSGKRHGRP